MGKEDFFYFFFTVDKGWQVASLRCSRSISCCVYSSVEELVDSTPYKDTQGSVPHFQANDLMMRGGSEDDHEREAEWARQ